VIGFILGLVVIVALLLYADLTQVVASLESFTWAYLPLILGLTLSNYALRFVKWHVYLRLINVTQISVVDSLLIFGRFADDSFLYPVVCRTVGYECIDLFLAAALSPRAVALKA
jgi:hypothetical protein